MGTTIAEYKAQGAIDLIDFTTLLALRELDNDQVDRIQAISDKYRGHPLFEKAARNAYDNYVTRDGCSCHICAPCSWCTRDIPL